MTAGEALAALRTWRPDVEDIDEVHLIDRHGRLTGMVGMRRLPDGRPRDRAWLTSNDPGNGLAPGGDGSGRSGPADGPL